MQSANSRDLFFNQLKATTNKPDSACGAAKQEFCATLERVAHTKTADEVFPRQASRAADSRTEQLVRQLEAEKTNKTARAGEPNKKVQVRDVDHRALV
jgi:hypothetical protein